MNFKEKEGYYYEFYLDGLFVPIDMEESYHRRILAANHSNQQLGKFISENIVENGLNFNSDRIFLITKDQSKVIEMKEFCNFVIQNEILLNLALNHILGSFSLEKYQKGLCEAYGNFALNKELKNELTTKSKNTKKRAKV